MQTTKTTWPTTAFQTIYYSCLLVLFHFRAFLYSFFPRVGTTSPKKCRPDNRIQFVLAFAIVSKSRNDVRVNSVHLLSQFLCFAFFVCVYWMSTDLKRKSVHRHKTILPMSCYWLWQAYCKLINRLWRRKDISILCPINAKQIFRG